MTWLRMSLFFMALLLWKVVVAGAQGLDTTGATLVGYLWVAGVAGVGLWRLPPPADGLFGRPVVGDLTVGICAGALLFVLGIFAYAATEAVTGAGLPEEARSFFDASSATGWGLVLTTTLLGVVAEEAAFRGVLLGEARTATSAPVAVLVTSALFAAFHLSLLQAASTFVLGCGLAWLTLSRGRLAPALVAHGTYNLLGIALAVLARG